MIAGNTLIYTIALKEISDREFKSVLVSVLGLILLAVLVWLTRRLAGKASISPSLIGKLKNLVFGALVGLMISVGFGSH